MVQLRRTHHVGWRITRAWVAVLMIVGLLSATGCTYPTLRHYTPADGVNLEAGGLKVHNLMILSHQEGSGFLSATLTADQPDALTAVSGVALKPDYSVASTLTVSMPGPVAVGNQDMVILTKGPFITVKGQGLKAGLEADLTFQFEKAGDLKIRVPVVDGDLPEYATLTPVPSASPSSGP